MDFELEVSPAGQNLWDGSIDSGGDRIINEGTSNEGREYTMTPTLTMPAGDYDLRSKKVVVHIYNRLGSLKFFLLLSLSKKNSSSGPI